MIRRALDHHMFDAVPQNLSVDALAYFSGLNLLNAVMQDSDDKSIPLKTKLREIPKKSTVFSKPIYNKQDSDTHHYVIVAKVILVYRLDKKGTVGYYLNNFGSHNEMTIPKSTLKNKTGSIIIPYDLMAVVDKKLMPIDVLSAIVQHPMHTCFHYKLSPSPATSFVVENDLNKQLAFITHPNLLIKTLDLKGTHEEQIKSISYDVKMALQWLKDNDDILVSDKAISDLSETDEQLSKIDGKACIEIYHE